MKECDNCAYGGWLNGKDAITEICTKCRYICGEPTKWKAKPMTNADRIRAMSDEELAKWLVKKTKYQESAWSEPSYLNFLTESDDTMESAIKGTVEWLKQPADMRGEEE